jgi:hypothetical protein
MLCFNFLCDGQVMKEIEYQRYLHLEAHAGSSCMAAQRLHSIEMNADLATTL